jgi:hypothetical protein
MKLSTYLLTVPYQQRDNVCCHVAYRFGVLPQELDRLPIDIRTESTPDYATMNMSGLSIVWVRYLFADPTRKVCSTCEHEHRACDDPPCDTCFSFPDNFAAWSPK